MSYTILYRVAYLKMSDNTYVPVGEVGDNNVWECDNRRRSRDWCTGWSFFFEKLSYTEQEIRDIINDCIERNVSNWTGYKSPSEDHAYTRDEILKNYGNFASVGLYGQRGCRISSKQYLGWFLKGVRNAHPFKDFNNWTSIYVCAYKKEGWERIRVNSETELKEAYERLKAEGLDPSVHYDCITDYTYKHFICAEKQTQTKPLTKAFVVAIDGGWHNGMYILRNSARRFLLTGDKERAHKYGSATATRKLTDKLRRNGYGCRVEELDLTA